MTRHRGFTEFMMFKWVCLAVFFSLLLMHGRHAVAADDCGDVVIASMNWSSAAVIAEIDSVILSTGFGCSVQFSNGDPVSSFASMRETGTPHIFPELWLNSAGVELDALVNSGHAVIAGSVFADGGEEGWWIPRYIADNHPEINTIEDALERPDLFPSADDETLAAVHNCPVGWQCQIPTANLFDAFGAGEKGFELVDTGSAAGLDASIAKAHSSESGWLGYYWSPTPLLGRFEMVRLDMGTHDPVTWERCIIKADCIEPDTNAWPSSRVISLVSDDFAVKPQALMNYVSARQWDNASMNELLSWMNDSQSTGNEAALHFLRNHADIWSRWVPADIAAKVVAELPAP